MTDCCQRAGVREDCLDICSSSAAAFYGNFQMVDLEYLQFRPGCFGELHKLMNCAAGLYFSFPRVVICELYDPFPFFPDGSDHRHCCSRSGVPRDCLDWCRGSPLSGIEEQYQSEAEGRAALCALQHLPDIGVCFSEGREVLPGKPRNLRIAGRTPDTARAEWDPPVKNPGRVRLYRVIVRMEGQR